MELTDQIHCPKCNSTQITANKKGFSGRNAVAGVVLTGGIGLLAGTIGSNKILITCLNCGNQFRPGQQKSNNPKTQLKNIPADDSKPTAPKMIWNMDLKKYVPNENEQAVAARRQIDLVQQRKTNKKTATVLWPLFLILGIVFLSTQNYFFGGVMLFLFLFFLAAASAKVEQKDSAPDKQLPRQ